MLSAEEFKRQIEENPAIKELFEEFESWISQLQLILEDPDDQATERDFQQARGSLRALRNVLNAPTVMYESKLAHAKKQEERNDG